MRSLELSVDYEKSMVHLDHRVDDLIGLLVIGSCDRDCVSWMACVCHAWLVSFTYVLCVISRHRRYALLDIYICMR